MLGCFTVFHIILNICQMIKKIRELLRFLLIELKKKILHNILWDEYF